MQEFCKLRKLPLFKSKSRAFRRKNRKSEKRQKINDEQAISTERLLLERQLSEKRYQRKLRHLRRSSPVKRNVINSSLIKKQKKFRKKPVLRFKNPKHKLKDAKKLVQRKVVTCKNMLAANTRGRQKPVARRSKSSSIQSKQMNLPDVKLKITSTIQDLLDNRKSQKPTYIVRFREVEKQFGEVIERIKNLKFSAPE